MQPYVSIDIETTGLDEEKCQVIEIAAAIDVDGRTPIEDLPQFNRLITYPTIQGEPYALQMNSNILIELSKFTTFDTSLQPNNVVLALAKFLHKNLPEGETKYTPAGKNYASFDKKFLEKLPFFKLKVGAMLAHRTLDPGNLYWDPYEDGLVLPDTKLCLFRAGLEPTNSHRALGDAIDVVRLIRYKINKMGGLLEWSKGEKQLVGAKYLESKDSKKPVSF